MISTEQQPVILVTGATGAIGFEIAAQAAQAGATVAIHGSSAESVARASERLRERAPEARLIAAPADFRDHRAIAPMVDRAADEGGRLDAVIHCAITGVPGVSGPFGQCDASQFGAMAAAVIGSFQSVCHAALPHLARNGGTIVGFAADSGKFASPRQSVMGGCYGAIMSFVRNLALETARDGVRVHCISPSFVADTPIYEAFTQNPRAAAATARAGLGLPTPRDIAPMALFLCSPQAAKITGQVISINGGLNA